MLISKCTTKEKKPLIYKDFRLIINDKKKTVGRYDCINLLFLFWRRQRDSNPRGVAPKRFSRPPRYDHFDMPPRKILSCLRNFICDIRFSRLVPLLKNIVVSIALRLALSLFLALASQKRLSIIFCSLPRYDRFDMPPSTIMLNCIAENLTAQTL